MSADAHGFLTFRACRTGVAAGWSITAASFITVTSLITAASSNILKPVRS